MPIVNLKKLAKELNLSVSTVSKAFGNNYAINQQTRERVLALASKLNYQPNLFATSLRKQKSNTLALIIPEIENNFFVQAINGIEKVAQEKGYHVLIYLTHNDPAKELALLQHLQNGRVDAILISLSSNTNYSKQIKELRAKGIPLVLFDRVDTTGTTIKIKTDNKESSYHATNELIKAGCKKILHFTIQNNLLINIERKAGYEQALRHAGREVHSEWIVNYNLSENEPLMEKVLLNLKPDGVFCSFETLALQTYKVCNKLKIDIPGTLKLITFSNLETAQLLNPSLSAIVQPAFEMGKTATTTLFQLLEGKIPYDANQIIIIPSTYIKGTSVSNSKLL